MDELLSRASKSNTSDTKSTSLDVLVLEARTLCSAATGRNGGHLQPIVHAAAAGILSFEMSNFKHVESLMHERDINCDFRRLPGCLGFWNRTYFEEAKSDLSTAAREYSDLVRVVEDADELRNLGLKGGAVGAIVQSVAASLSPYKLCVEILEGLLRKYESPSNGGMTLNLQTNTPVTSLERHRHITSDKSDEVKRWTIHTPRGPVTAHTVILTTNAYTSHLLPQFSALIRPVQAQMSALIPPSNHTLGKSESGKSLPMSYGFEGVGSMDRVMSDYLVQTPYVFSIDGPAGHGGHLMFGGGRHIARNHGEGCWDDGFVDKHVESYLRSLPERLNLEVQDAAEFKDDETQPILTTSNPSAPRPASKALDLAASWTGIIGHSADGPPWVGAVPDMPGVFLSAGYSGHGMTRAPLCGRYIARKALEGLNSRGEVAPERHGVGERQAEEGAADEVTASIHKLDIDAKLDDDVDVPKEYVITLDRMQRAMDHAQEP